MCMHCYSKETDGGPASYLHSAGARRHNVALGGSETYCRVRGDESLRPNLFPWPFVKLPWHMEVHSNIMMALSISVLVACVSLRAWVCVCVCVQEKEREGPTLRGVQLEHCISSQNEKLTICFLPPTAWSRYTIWSAYRLQEKIQSHTATPSIYHQSFISRIPRPELLSFEVWVIVMPNMCQKALSVLFETYSFSYSCVVLMVWMRRRCRQWRS